MPPILKAGSAGQAGGGKDWPGFLGAQRDGSSSETGWSTDWGASGPKTLWQAQVGVGYSCVSVSDGKAYTMGNAADVDTGVVKAVDRVLVVVQDKSKIDAAPVASFVKSGVKAELTASLSKVAVAGSVPEEEGTLIVDQAAATDAQVVAKAREVYSNMPETLARINVKPLERFVQAATIRTYRRAREAKRQQFEEARA